MPGSSALSPHQVAAALYFVTNVIGAVVFSVDPRLPVGFRVAVLIGNLLLCVALTIWLWRGSKIALIAGITFFGWLILSRAFMVMVARPSLNLGQVLFSTAVNIVLIALLALSLKTGGHWRTVKS